MKANLFSASLTGVDLFGSSRQSSPCCGRANHTQWSPRTDNFQKALQRKERRKSSSSAPVSTNLSKSPVGNATEPVGGISTFYFSAPMKEDGSKSKGQGKEKAWPQTRKARCPEHEPDPVGYSFSEEQGALFFAAIRTTFTRADHFPRGLRRHPRLGLVRLRPGRLRFSQGRGEVRVIIHNIDLERPLRSQRRVSRWQSI